MRRKSVLKELPTLPPLNYDLQVAIISHYPPELINEKKEELCKRCGRHNFDCRLLPITTQGEDCPYFEEGGS